MTDEGDQVKDFFSYLIYRCLDLNLKHKRKQK